MTPAGHDPTSPVGAIVAAVAYADIFDFPLTVAEIHRYLSGVAVSDADVQRLLTERLMAHQLAYCDGFYMLPGREHLVDIRRQRAENARRLWPLAFRYGRYIAALPFVRMLAVTGSLAVNNPDSQADVDYFLVTANDRLWLCRALVVGVVHWAARRGVVLCPNYLIAERALDAFEHNIYTARELVQMVPLTGWPVYRRLRQINAWTLNYLPNAGLTPPRMPALSSSPRWQRVTGCLGEWALRTPPGAWLERWERQRKIAKLSQMGLNSETEFGRDWCKGHFDAHAQRVLQTYDRQLETLHVEG